MFATGEHKAKGISGRNAYLSHSCDEYGEDRDTPLRMIALS
jgi:hypothetical protein